MIERGLKLCLLLLFCLLAACSEVRYYSQSIVGHSKLMLARQSLADAIEKARAAEDETLLQQLQLAQRLRDFSINTLALPDNGSYRTYVDLPRQFAVWNVVAADEFSVSAHQWCYLVIGCASYRGFFSQEAALAEAEKLRTKGFEVAVGGVTAYSTLGWFDDPVLPSMWRDGEAQFAEVLFHELAHQVLYIKNQSDFNEAFATVVGEQGAELWLAAAAPNLLATYQRHRQQQAQLIALLLEVRTELASLYQQPLQADAMRTEKHRIFASLVTRYEHLKRDTWEGDQQFDAWFRVPFNNARLASVATYHAQVTQLTRLFRECSTNFGAAQFERFYQVLHTQRRNLQESADTITGLTCAP